MRLLLLASAAALFPVLAMANPQCAITATPNPAPVRSDAAAPVRVALGSTQPASPASDVPDASLPPVLRHIAEAGARIEEMGFSHGLHSVVARDGQQFRMLLVTPDGQAVVGGIVSELAPEQLLAAAGGQSKELGEAHGLRTLFVTNGGQFQVFYVTPDGERVVPGAMWDAAGKNLTRDQVTPIPGAIATVEVGPGATGIPVDGAISIASSAVAAVQTTSAGVIGDPDAPKVWMFIDPMCSFSVRAMQQLQPLIQAKRLQLAPIPISVLDHEDQGRSTSSALAMLSFPADQMVSAWAGGHLDKTPGPDASAKLAANTAAATAIGLRGTPTLVWRKTDGTEGRSDGLPSDLAAFAASIGR